MDAPIADTIAFVIWLLFGSSLNCNIMLHLMLQSGHNLNINVSIHLHDILTFL